MIVGNMEDAFEQELTLTRWNQVPVQGNAPEMSLMSVGCLSALCIRSEGLLRCKSNASDHLMPVILQYK